MPTICSDWYREPRFVPAEASGYAGHAGWFRGCGVRRQAVDQLLGRIQPRGDQVVSSLPEHHADQRSVAALGWATRIFGGVREVLHAVLADALGELEARLLLLGTRLSTKPAGSRPLHAPMAFFHSAVLGSSDDPRFIP
jgi:hypothetical protein